MNLNGATVSKGSINLSISAYPVNTTPQSCADDKYIVRHWQHRRKLACENEGPGILKLAVERRKHREGWG